MKAAICTHDLASSPGHSQIPSFSPWLQDKIWEWPGDKATHDQVNSILSPLAIACDKLGGGMQHVWRDDW